MKKLLFLALCSFGFAVEVDNIYEEAQALENQGKYKEAMILYKKVANLKVSKEDKYVNDLNEKQILKKGDKLLLIGFGVGYSWGTTIIEY